MRRPIALLALCSLLTLGGVGCSTKPVSREDDTTQDLNHIARVYGLMISVDHHPPRDEEELRQSLLDFHKADMNPHPDEIMVSSRDKQPYVIIYKANFGTAASSEIVAYEKTGAEGKRYVLTMSRDVRQLSDQEFRQATFANGHRPSAS